MRLDIPCNHQFFYLLIVVGSLLFAGTAIADTAVEEPFQPTWRLLNYEEKQQFISGYLKGSDDASDVLDIAIGFIKDNPQEALPSLKKLRELYDLSEVKPDSLVRELETFFADSDNSRASLAKAIATARNRLLQ